jgi:hypothetical protein
MIMAAIVPPLWRRVMDHRVLAVYGGDLSKANVWPPAQRGLHRRFDSAPTSVLQPSQPTPQRARSPRMDEPGSAWLGALASLLVVAASTEFLLWTVLPVPGFRHLQENNSLISTPLLLVALLVLRSWRLRVRSPQPLDEPAGAASAPGSVPDPRAP